MRWGRSPSPNERSRLNLLTVALEYYSTVACEVFELRKRHSHIGAERTDRSAQVETLYGICDQITEAESRVAEAFNSDIEKAAGSPGQPGDVEAIINWTYRASEAMAEWHLLRELARDLGVSFDAFEARSLLTNIANHYVEQGSSIVARLRAETDRLNLEEPGPDRAFIFTMSIEAPKELFRVFHDELAKLRVAN